MFEHLTPPQSPASVGAAAIADVAAAAHPLPRGGHHPSHGARSVPRPAPYQGPERRRSALAQRQLALLLELVDYGMVLLADGQRVAWANGAARRLLQDLHPLMLQEQELVARRDGDAVALREAISAAQRGLRKLLRLGVGPHSMVVAVLPLAPESHGGAHGVALLLSRQQLCEELSVAGYARAHNLTGAETAVLRLLCTDLTPAEIAEHQGVGLATVRTQIGAIRHKTGMGSIRALVRQVSLLPPMVNALQTQPALGLDGLTQLGDLLAEAATARAQPPAAAQATRRVDRPRLADAVWLS